MKHVSMLSRFAMLALVLAGVVLVTGQASAQAPATSPCSESMLCGSFPTTLVKSLDSKKLKEGDVVVVQTAAPIRAHGMLIPTGSKITGHITQSQAKSKGDSQSALAMAFDKLEVSKGHELPMKGAVQAIAPPLGGNNGPDTSSMMGSPQMMAGHSDGTTTPNNGGNAGIHPIDAGSGPRPIVNKESQGVLGFKGLEMDKDGVITCSGKEVKLDNGTQLMLRSEIQMPVM